MGISLGVVSPAPKLYLIETEDDPLDEDLKYLEDAMDPAKMGKVVEKVSNDVMEAIEGEKTYGEMLEMGKEDLKLIGEAVDTAKMKDAVERVYQDIRQRGDYGDDSLDFDKIIQIM